MSTLGRRSADRPSAGAQAPSGVYPATRPHSLRSKSWSRVDAQVTGHGLAVPRVPRAWYSKWYSAFAGQTGCVPGNHVYHRILTCRWAGLAQTLLAPLHPDVLGRGRGTARNPHFSSSQVPNHAPMRYRITASSGVQLGLHPAPQGAGSRRSGDAVVHPRTVGAS